AHGRAPLQQHDHQQNDRWEYIAPQVLEIGERVPQFAPPAGHSRLGDGGRYRHGHSPAPALARSRPLVSASAPASNACTNAMYVSSRLARRTSRSWMSSPHSAKSSRTNWVGRGVVSANAGPVVGEVLRGSLA